MGRPFDHVLRLPGAQLEDLALAIAAEFAPVDFAAAHERLDWLAAAVGAVARLPALERAERQLAAARSAADQVAERLTAARCALADQVAGDVRDALADTRSTFAIVVTSNRSPRLSRPDLRYADDDGAKYYELFRMLAPESKALHSIL